MRPVPAFISKRLTGTSRYANGPANAGKPTPPPPSDCPDGWEDIGGQKCYKFKFDSLVRTRDKMPLILLHTFFVRIHGVKLGLIAGWKLGQREGMQT